MNSSRNRTRLEELIQSQQTYLRTRSANRSILIANIIDNITRLSQLVEHEIALDVQATNTLNALTQQLGGASNSSSNNINSNLNNQNSFSDLFSHIGPTRYYTFDLNNVDLTSLLDGRGGSSSTRGLTDEEYQRITQTITYDASINIDDSRCPITLQNFNQGQEVAQIRNCQHTFSPSALRQWFNSHQTCPVCRNNVLSSNRSNSNNNSSGSNDNNGNANGRRGGGDRDNGSSRTLRNQTNLISTLLSGIVDDLYR